jgi:hypothetical protein
MSVPYHERVLQKHPSLIGDLRSSAPTAHDSSSNGRNGTYRGQIAFRQHGAITSEHDRAIGLNRIDAFVEVANSELLASQQVVKGSRSKPGSAPTC